MKQVTFVILHYMSLDITVKCVESIFFNIKYENFKIVIVDNASPNQTGRRLAAIYKDNNKVTIILSEINTGFSVGNNLGYKYAKENFHSDFIIMINNDTEIVQQNFIEQIIRIYKESAFHVLGPDVINLEGIHQSPHRDYVIKKREARLWYLKRFLFSKYLHWHKALKLPDNSFVMRNYLKHDNERIQSLKFSIKQENIELQGACIIFSPLFITNSDIAFEELTFMYGEEPILVWRCKKNNWKILYDPSLKIKHAQRYATNLVNTNLIDKEIFWSDNHVKAIRALLKVMK